VNSHGTEAAQQAWASRKRTVDGNGLRIAYVEIAGAEPPLLLVHGFTDTSRSFSLLAPHLAGRRLIIPDLRGHGGSDAGGGFHIEDFAGDLALLISRLGLDRPVVVGHSLGAMIAIRLAAGHPESVGGLVLLAGAVKADIADHHPMVSGVTALRDPISPADPFYAWWHACRPEVSPTFLAMMAQEASTMPAARWRAILDEIRRTDLTGLARTVRVRTLVIAGACDELFGKAHQEALRRALPHASLIQAQGCGHNPHWEDPAFVASAICSNFDRASSHAI
jgi:pimeloyl-ACP methyl ester carboxylesterase